MLDEFRFHSTYEVENLPSLTYIQRFDPRFAGVDFQDESFIITTGIFHPDFCNFI